MALIALLVGLAGLGVFAALAVQIAMLDALPALDSRLFDRAVAARTPVIASLFVVLTWFGDVLVWAPLALLAGSALASRARSATPLLLLLVAGVVSATAMTVTKALVDRPRPDPALAVAVEANAGFPSGHATNSTTIYLTLALLLTVVVRTTWVRVVAWSGALVLIAAVGVSRVVLGVHSPTDVLGGWLLGTSWVLVLVGGWALVSARTPRSRPASGRAVPPGAPRGSGVLQPPGSRRS